ncbi:hypothetical protein [Gordonia sp. DT101]|uniref:hypothetical protein n=1 Tax=Gordonia sp. DT101 TaxID=3416545 RepID=UPI003CEAAA3E
MTTSADTDPQWVPPVDELAETCAAIAFMALDASKLAPREPTGDLNQIDAALDQGASVNILRFAHEATTGYLQGAGDLLHSLARLAKEHPPAISPSVLARCTAEYAAFAWWLSDPTDSPEQRASKSRRISQTALNEHTSEPGLNEFRHRFNAWSSRTRLPKTGKPDPETLIKTMLGTAYDEQVKATSRYVHPDAITLVTTMVSADRGHPRNHQVVWNDAMFAAWAVIAATERVTGIRDGDLSTIRSAKLAFNRLVDMVAD